MKKNGFTLLELLAILIILSLIAIITIPVVFNMIDSSKKGTVKDSAYGYISSIQKMYYSNQLDDSFFEFEDRGYTVSELKSLGISFDGQEPIGDSWVLFSNNDVVKACLQFDDYRVDIEGDEVTNVFKGECEEYIEFNGKFVEASEGDTHKGIVYLDPTDLSNTCDETNYDSNLGTKTGCMKFYIFDENSNGTVDMILDHNTSLGIKWASVSGVNANDNGPREALYQLYEDTKNWVDLKFLTADSNYEVDWISKGVNKTHTIDYTKHLAAPDSYEYSDELGAYKARFITAEEIADTIGADLWSIDSQWHYFDSHSNTESNSKSTYYGWLFDNLYNCYKFGCSSNSTQYAGNYGYWTSSPTTYYQAWLLGSDGTNIQGIANILAEYYGIRPVITIPKYVLGID